MQNYFLGSLLSGGSSDPKAGNSLQAWTDLYDRVQTLALKSRIANFKVPKAIFVAAELPRNAMGKVQKNVLRDRYGSR